MVTGGEMTEKEFPHKEIRNKSGDYFDSYQEAATAAIKEHKLTSNHVWSVCYVIFSNFVVFSWLDT